MAFGDELESWPGLCLSGSGTYIDSRADTFAYQFGLNLGKPDQRCRDGRNLRCNLLRGAALGAVLDSDLDLDLAPVS